MKKLIKSALRALVSAEAYARIRYGYWCLTFYFPRRLTASRVALGLEAFPVTGNALREKLGRIRIGPPTGLCRLMTRCESDKGLGWHNYSMVYAELFAELRARPLRVFELGLGMNDQNPSATAGITCNPGGSLRAWREYFPQASIFGADIERSILFQAERIRTFYCDQLDASSIQQLWQQPELADPMDILIEDGLHTFEGNVSFLEGSLARVQVGGYYIVEDVEAATLGQWRSFLADCAVRYPEYEFVIAELPNPMNFSDNNLIVVHRKAGKSS
jgi:hypothetical protein